MSKSSNKSQANAIQALIFCNGSYIGSRPTTQQAQDFIKSRKGNYEIKLGSYSIHEGIKLVEVVAHENSLS